MTRRVSERIIDCRVGYPQLVWNFVLTRGSVWFKMVASGTEWGLDEHPVLTLFSKK